MKMFEAPKWEITQASEKLNKQLFGSKSERKKLKIGQIGPSPERSTSNTYKEKSQEKIGSSVNAPSKKKKRKKTSIENVEGKILSGNLKYDKKTENLPLGNKLSKSQKRRLKKKHLQENKMSKEKSSQNSLNSHTQKVDGPKKLNSQENSPSNIHEKNSHAKKKKKHQSLQNSPISDERGDSGIERSHLKPMHKKKLSTSFKTSNEVKQNGVVSSKLNRNQKRRLRRKAAALKKKSSTASDSVFVVTKETGSDLSDISKLKKKKKNKLTFSMKQELQNPDSVSPSSKLFKRSNSTEDEGLKNISVSDVAKVEDASNVSKKKKRRKRKQKSNLADSDEVSTTANLSHHPKSDMQSGVSKSSKQKKRKHLLDSNVEVDHKKQKFSGDSKFDKDTESSPLSSKKKRKHSLAVDVESVNDTHKMKRQRKDSSDSEEISQPPEDNQTASPSQNTMKKKKRRRRKKKEEITNTDGELASPAPQPNPNSKSPHFIQKLKQIIQNQQNTNSSVAKQQKKDGQSGNLRERMMNRLQASRFRYLNEQLYSCEGKEAQKLFRSDPDSFKAYHEGYQQQVSQWPLNPVDKIIKSIKKKSDNLVIADFGCGDARLARSVPNKVHSFDLVALSEEVTACDMAHTPLDPASVDIAVFCLSLMGTNLSSYILEANRVLKEGGQLKIAEVESRFENVDGFIKDLTKFGFVNTLKDLSHNLFYFLDFKKQSSVKYSNKLPQLSLKPCLYKKR